MALKKEVLEENGITTNYHRILFINNVINKHNSIAVLSYIDETHRNKELEGKSVYTSSTTHEIQYIENMSVEDAYRYLKSLDKYKNSIDV